MPTTPGIDWPHLRDGEQGLPPRPKVALVHDFLLDVRGAERVFIELCRLWPEADLFTAVYDEAGTEGRFAGRRIHTSFIQRLRPSARTFRAWLPDNPHIHFFDSRYRGYVSVEIRKEQAAIDMRVVSDIRDPAAKISSLQRFTVEGGRPGVNRA